MTNAALDSSLTELPLSGHTKVALAIELLDINASSQQHLSLDTPGLCFDTYWKFYTRECTRALHDGGRHVAVRNHGDIIDCARKLRDGTLRNDLRDHVRQKLTTAHANSEEMVDNSIDLAATLLLMASFCTYAYGFSGRNQLHWDGAESLGHFMASYFEPGHTLQDSSIKLEKIFTARNLTRIAGLEIVWTDNLVDHLRLTDDDTRVHIFHHASFLEAHKASFKSLLPKGLAEETLRTLALFFPSGDSETRKWIVNIASADENEGLDRRIIQCGRLSTDNRQIDRFRFWRERLVTLKQVFDEAHPNTLSRWWYDRRNGVQFYTFWVAVLVLILTIIFGLVQSIEGAIQVYASLKSMKGPEDKMLKLGQATEPV